MKTKFMKKLAIILVILTLFGCEEMSKYDKNNEPLTIYDRLDNIECRLDYIDSTFITITNTLRTQNNIDSVMSIRITQVVDNMVKLHN